MPDIIHLLPDSVANQIAAGEVIQRPASAIKELLENSIDSGADEIKLIIKDAGKGLIQVIDNGCGMSETDARMSFERHATSKIQEANDLFAIKTLGFRGEALASMAAIAQVELKTKRVEDELGTCINIFGSEVKSQEPCVSQDGTSISIKNLFFNVPARRKFLKSNTTEIRHIIEEFQRVALVNPEIKFSFFNETYFIYFKIDPKDIDINIHPTKTEINFQNNQVIYAILSSTIKEALGKFNIVPSIDFNVEPTISFIAPSANQEIKPPTIKLDPDYNPFETNKEKDKGFESGYRKKPDTTGWEKLYNESTGIGREEIVNSTTVEKQVPLIEHDKAGKEENNNFAFQLHNKYLLTSVKSGLMIIDQHRAHERILFEQYIDILNGGKGLSQQQLFPITVQFPAGDVEILKTLTRELKILGFDIEEFGENTFIINGIPADLNNVSPTDVLENIIENFKKHLTDINADKKVNLARSMAVNMAIGYNRKLEQEEIVSLINKLFACKVPDVSPDGKAIVRILSIDELENSLG
ncbi:MAG: hypothetical protein B6D61_14095 [Bacteroidetes bacterium 4484_249]|nr:MAG: hypothetical protein B6D61_14095 [Bacteroidetes bacterium 4484_249]